MSFFIAILGSRQVHRGLVAVYSDTTLLSIDN